MSEQGSNRGYFGKYRGLVTDNDDKKKLGRVEVSVPAVYGTSHKAWAMPCIPYAGKDVGIFMMPPKDTNVWVEFEGGHPDYPIWVGCFWIDGEIPKDASKPEMKVVKTDKATILIDDSGDGKITVKLGTDARVVIEKDTMTMTTGSSVIKMTSDKVDVNNANLEVMA